MVAAKGIDVESDLVQCPLHWSCQTYTLLITTNRNRGDTSCRKRVSDDVPLLYQWDDSLRKSSVNEKRAAYWVAASKGVIAIRLFHLRETSSGHHESQEGGIIGMQIEKCQVHVVTVTFRSPHSTFSLKPTHD